MKISSQNFIKKKFYIIKYTVITTSCLLSFGFFAQNSGVGINPSGNLPDPSAALDINFNDKGFLIPRLTTVQRDAIQNPAIGLQIYNTTLDCLQGFMPISGWRDIVCDCSVFPSSAFTFQNNSAINTNITFQATTPGATYSWVFDQGSPATSNQQSPNISWTLAGTYSVTLTVTDALGCSSTTTQSITIINCVPGGSVTFSYTGSPQQWTAPNNMCGNTVTIEAWGAQGSGTGANYWGVGGKGGYSVGDYTVTPGVTNLFIVVGQAGFQSSSANAYNGGGRGNPGTTYGDGMTGGGATHVATVTGALAQLSGNQNSVIIVAGGGGGAAGSIGNSGWSIYAANGGDGGGINGIAGPHSNGDASYRPGGGGGTQVAGGASQTPLTASSFGRGADAATSTSDAIQGGGGGGGWYGGGAGAHAGGGGGGGSGYINPILLNAQTIAGNASMPNPNGGTMTGNTGDGFVRITW